MFNIALLSGFSPSCLACGNITTIFAWCSSTIHVSNFHSIRMRVILDQGTSQGPYMSLLSPVRPYLQTRSYSEGLGVRTRVHLFSGGDSIQSIRCRPRPSKVCCPVGLPSPATSALESKPPTFQHPLVQCPLCLPQKRCPCPRVEASSAVSLSVC